VLPVSSSGHVALLPRLLGWDYASLPGDTRKSFEVALHAGSAPVLAAVAVRAGRSIAANPIGLALTFLPPAVTGFALERPIERRLGGLRSVGLAQIAASAALLLADRRPRERDVPDAGDHLAVGLAQALALVPGVSRAGAALTAARLRGLSRPASLHLALTAALPVTLGAVALKGVRAAREDSSRELLAPALAGAGAALVSAAAASPVVGRLERAPSYAPLAAYRIGVGVLALVSATRPIRLNGPHGTRRLRAGRRSPGRFGLGRISAGRGARRDPDRPARPRRPGLRALRGGASPR
jgi:undecaprenyl-diphosphatase